MPDFEQMRAALKRARNDLAAKQTELDKARHARAHLELQVKEAQRTQSPRDADDVIRLESRLKEAHADETNLLEQMQALKNQITERENVYSDASDPREAITNWSGETPILLFPVRLETRFKHIDGGEGGAHDELWVRIFPDECSVDTFEAVLSETEVNNGRRYWIETWAAGGIEAQRRAAWRNLVASHGAGRAAWIVNQYSPKNAGPIKDNDQDVLLVIVTSMLPSDDEQEGLAAYWETVWLADGDKKKIDDAAASLADELNITIDSAKQLIARFEPANFATTPASPLKKSDVAVNLAWLVLEPAANLKTRSWTAPPRVHVLPDRFVVLGYQGGKLVFEEQGRTIPSPLVAGPDPSAPADQQISHDANGNLVVPDDMRWMVDFERAVEAGMGIKVSLDPSRVDLSLPIERVVALGLRLADDADGGRVRLEELLTHHRYGRAGFSFVPQGTPTNNTETGSAGYRRGEDAEAAYDALFGAAGQLKPTEDWWQRQDGQWLADALGVDWSVFDRVQHASGADFAEARALNRALWPATLGYAMETMLHPVFSARQVDATRWFYTHFVTGRGFLPCIRIGDQPYGVLPVSALSQWTWLDGERASSVGGLDPPAGFAAFLKGLAGVLAAMRIDWVMLTRAVSYVGRTGDAHQILLDVLGLHPASVEFHQRYAESLHHIFNRAKLQGLAAQTLDYIQVSGMQEPAKALLRKLGYRGEAEPDALQRFFFTRSHRLNGPVVDDRPLSERDPIRAYTEDRRNYIAWLADSARTSFEDLRLERGFKDDRAPDTLLYMMLRHALILRYWDASLRLHLANDVMGAEAVNSARRESEAIHVSGTKEGSESRYMPLYSKDERITGDANRTVAERIGEILGDAEETRLLADQLMALDLLKDVPTARLERCFAEHVDTASFRLDAWLLGLVHYQLAALRYRGRRRDEVAGDDGHIEFRRGIYLGAYGWLENLQRKMAPPQPVRLSDDLSRVFGTDDGDPLLRDPANGGYIFAPSISQATTAAILRAGYLANASPQAPGALSVNLSSARVRIALGLIEGIRNGQPLGALLGYRLQRGLHEDHAPHELDRFIYPLRKQFPLVANQLASTRDQGAAIETIEANNVVDGLKLIEHVQKSGNRSYPFGLVLPAATALERAAIDEEVDRLLDAHDALAALARLDLLLAAMPLSPRPTTAADYEAALTAANPPGRQQVFDAKLQQLKAILATADPRLAPLLAAVQGELPLSSFDNTPFAIDDVARDIDLFKKDIQARIGKLKTEVERRLKISKEQLDLHDAAATPLARVNALQKAGNALLGEDLKLIPEFTFGALQAAELVNAYGASGALTNYLKTIKKVDFPVEDWLHGAARVREKLFAWEQAALLAPVLGGKEPALAPLQLPFRSGEGWLALEFDPQLKTDGERLLYTAHHAVAPNPAAATCGLLIDEWTEVVPALDETAGLIFHYDRPSSEPPQTWLLVTPPRMGGQWRWSDLLGALDETFELARLRAVEPARIDTQSYAHFLPATTSAVTLYGVSIAANYSRVNNVMAHIKGGADG